jgi:hypothetical protein
MNRFLIIAGILFILAGVGWRWLARIPFGRLPGDLHIVRDGFDFHFPIVTCIVVSIVISVFFWVLRR